MIDPSQKGMAMLTRRAAVWAAVSGLVGTCMIGVSFAINTGPPAGASSAEMTAFGQQHHDAILWGSWLQAVGPVLIVLFALAIVFLAGATTRLAGWMTLFGTAALMTVSLIEITGYIGTLQTSPAGVQGICLFLASCLLPTRIDPSPKGIRMLTEEPRPGRQYPAWRERA